MDTELSRQFPVREKKPLAGSPAVRSFAVAHLSSNTQAPPTTASLVTPRSPATGVVDALCPPQWRCSKYGRSCIWSETLLSKVASPHRINYSLAVPAAISCRQTMAESGTGARLLSGERRREEGPVHLNRCPFFLIPPPLECLLTSRRGPHPLTHSLCVFSCLHPKWRLGVVAAQRRGRKSLSGRLVFPVAGEPPAQTPQRVETLRHTTPHQTCRLVVG